MLTLWVSCLLIHCPVVQAEQTKPIFQSVDKFTVGIAGRRLGVNYQAIDSFFTVGQIQSLVMCTVPTVKFKVIKGKLGIDV